jgi:hypothetical protein
LNRLMSFVELAEVATTPASFLLAGIFLDISVEGVFLAGAAAFLLAALWTVLSRSARRTLAAPAESAPATD